MKLYSRLIREFKSEYNFSEINEKRLAERISQLASIGMTNDNGSNRIGLY